MSRAEEYRILKYSDKGFFWGNDLVVQERQVEIYVNGQPHVTVMATPEQLHYLAVGYLYTEGSLDKDTEVKNISIAGLRVYVELEKSPPPGPARARSSGFGLGSVALKDIQINNLKPVETELPMIKADMIVEQMEEFNHLSELFWKTGAVHSAWLVKGENKYFSEDVGRHNAVDKVIGQYLSDGRFNSDQTGLIFTTGRISSEMILKTAKAGLSALVSRGAASRLAVDLAEKLNIILVGFARGNQFKAFWGGQYINGSPGKRGLK